jgi:hypothetical protein
VEKQYREKLEMPNNRANENARKGTGNEERKVKHMQV